VPFPFFPGKRYMSLPACSKLESWKEGRGIVFGDIFQGFEWVIILLIILLIFGPTKLPQLARGIGQALWEFKRASQGLIEEDEKKKKEEAKSKLSNVDDETIKKLAEKLGINTEGKKREDLIVEIVNEAKKKGILDEVTAGKQ
jgi:sec-independent protein translocase protein TatA